MTKKITRVFVQICKLVNAAAQQGMCKNHVGLESICRGADLAVFFGAIWDKLALNLVLIEHQYLNN